MRGDGPFFESNVEKICLCTEGRAIFSRRRGDNFVHHDKQSKIFFSLFSYSPGWFLYIFRQPLFQPLATHFSWTKCFLQWKHFSYIPPPYPSTEYDFVLMRGEPQIPVISQNNLPSCGCGKLFIIIRNFPLLFAFSIFSTLYWCTFFLALFQLFDIFDSLDAFPLLFFARFLRLLRYVNGYAKPIVFVANVCNCRRRLA